MGAADATGRATAGERGAHTTGAGDARPQTAGPLPRPSTTTGLPRVISPSPDLNTPLPLYKDRLQLVNSCTQIF